jgi:hypothetical protein
VNQQTFSGKLSGRQTQLDGLNNLHVFWKGTVPVPGGTVTGLYYHCLSADLVWGEQQIPTGYDAVKGAVYKAFDTGTQVALAWDGGDQEWVGLWDGCNQIAQEEMPLSAKATLESVAISLSPRKFCAVAKDGSYSLTAYEASCADIR